MSLYSERDGRRKPAVERTSEITADMYPLLFGRCEKYLDYLAWDFPAKCGDDPQICCGTDLETLGKTLKFDMPDLFRNAYGIICKPDDRHTIISNDEQYALLDFIEYVGKNLKDFQKVGWHSFYDHHHLIFLETDEIFEKYRQEINGIFERTRLQYTLTAEKTIERTTEHGVVTEDDFKDMQNSIKEEGIKELLDKAYALFKKPDPQFRADAVEKLWDAFERLKTYYSKNTPYSAGRIVKDMGMGVPKFEELFNKEFKELWEIGNEFRVRHHGKGAVDITDTRHYDYFFNRCMSLIKCVTQFLRNGGD